jgi:hypothetical protein
MYCGRFETQMMSSNGFHPFLSVIEMGEGAAPLIEISQPMKDVYVPWRGTK